MQSSISHFAVIQNFAPTEISLGVARALLRPRTYTFWYNKWGGSHDLTVMLQAVSLVTFLTIKIDCNKNTKMVTYLILSQRTSILIITRWKRTRDLMNRVFPTTLFPAKALVWLRELRIYCLEVNSCRLEELFIY